jgi:hypothetical protein
VFELLVEAEGLEEMAEFFVEFDSVWVEGTEVGLLLFGIELEVEAAVLEVVGVAI